MDLSAAVSFDHLHSRGDMPACAAVGPYLLRGALGEPARGHVRVARDSRYGSEVALKLAAFDDAAACARLRNEAELAAPLAHPHVVRVFDTGEDQQAGLAWLSMELLPGVRVPLSLECFDQLLQALGYLHEHGIVHGDVKPANLLATADGRLKLADFGLARRIGAGPAPAQGTPRYMSPEQARGAALDARSDVFSAGAILFELLAGRPAFSGAPFDIVRQVLAARPCWDGLGATPFEPLVRRALSRDRAERQADGHAFLVAFRTACRRA
jgi:serine/threonine-protein kinase